MPFSSLHFFDPAALIVEAPDGEGLLAARSQGKLSRNNLDLRDWPDFLNGQFLSGLVSGGALRAEAVQAILGHQETLPSP